MSDEYSELGEIISVFTCPDCGEDLQVETREDLHHSYVGLACPAGHTGMAVRLRDAARLGETFEARRVPRCIECFGQITDVEEPPETDDGHVAHPGDCYEEYQRKLKLLGDSR